MSYTAKAERLRAKLAYYDKASFLACIFGYLHTPEESSLDTAKKMPWVAFLLIEWLFQVEQSATAKTASKRDVHELLNQLYALQSDAVKFREDISTELILRKIIIGQLWVQQHKLHYWFGLTRLYALITGEGKTTWFADNFYKTHQIALDDFFALSLWLIIKFDNSKTAIPYQRVLIELLPHYSIETISTFLNMVGGTVSEFDRMLSKLKDESVRADSYFASTNLSKKPLMLLEAGIVTPHLALLAKSISSFVLEDFKSRDHEKFRNKFTPEFEKYTQIALEESGIPFVNEDQIEKTFKESGQKDSKVVDFIVTSDNANVFIDAKGIEPVKVVQVTHDSRKLKDRLSKSFTHGVEQAFACAATVSAIDHESIEKKDRSYALIVTHHNFYFSNGKKLNDHVDPELHEKLKGKHGDQIPIENVYFVAMEDFEGILLICKEADVELCSFLDFCIEQDKAAETQKFDMRQHIQDFARQFLPEHKGPIGTDYLIERKDELFDSVTNALQVNDSYWRSIGLSGLFRYFRIYDDFKMQLGLLPEFSAYEHLKH